MAESVTVRIPITTYKQLMRMLDQETVVNSDGEEVKVESLFLPNGASNLSASQGINIALLAYMSSTLKSETVNFLITQTPKTSNDAVKFAAQRLVPDKTGLVAATELEKIKKDQKREFEEIKASLVDVRKNQTSHFKWLVKAVSAVVRGISYLIGYMSQEKLADIKTYVSSNTLDVEASLKHIGDVEVDKMLVDRIATKRVENSDASENISKPF